MGRRLSEGGCPILGARRSTAQFCTLPHDSPPPAQDRQASGRTLANSAQREGRRDRAYPSTLVADPLTWIQATSFYAVLLLHGAAGGAVGYQLRVKRLAAQQPGARGRIAERTTEVVRQKNELAHANRGAEPSDPAARGEIAAARGVDAARRAGEPGQGRVPRQRQPRDPHADERHPRHDRAGARHRAHARAAALSRDRARRGQLAARSSSTTCSTSRRSRRASSS